MIDTTSHNIADLKQHLSNALDEGVNEIKAHQEEGLDIPETMHERLIRIRSMQESLEKGEDIRLELEHFEAWKKENNLI
ncbi:hypothetical protein [Pseudomonas luteola]|uniref:hypothetical protein n=1 Tax=Pseudomonas luteola TaxID=47886 RepID=UPI00123A583C|nr:MULTISPECIES: hypothetical protein [Pseudomonas]MBA1247052.1 hypothetical protein [Pseudomonas zeshuii]QEU28320.1 hypothetical protein FOB45_11150 [Pseudomonas luteola]